jgi:hypothetical protein
MREHTLWPEFKDSELKQIDHTATNAPSIVKVR